MGAHFFGGGHETMQQINHFEGFPLYKCIVWVGTIMTP